MRKLIVCCATLGAFALASPSAYAGGHGGNGNGNGAHQDHTCQGGHNCNTTTPPPPTTPPVTTPPAPPVVAPPSTTTTTSTTVNVTYVTVQAPASVPAACSVACAAAPPVVTVVRDKIKRRHCRRIRVKHYRKVWHSGYNNCGKLVRWYVYKKVVRKRRVCA